LEIVVLVDDNAPAGRPSVNGFSALVDADDYRILFDTGPDGEVLIDSLKEEGVLITSLDHVVISHSHPDHIGGLSRILYHCPRIEISVPASSVRDVARKLPPETVIVGETEPRELHPGIMLTGEQGAGIPEQSLLIATEGGWAAVVGCGHPGIETLVAAAEGDLKLVVGGLHDIESSNPMLPWIGKFIACHCTPDKRVLAHRLENVELGGVGTRVELP
jgi:7,8-dihydropterin-6-yl-methyl-4-(beta-D-ribofuranosyl)aminobenzene 5'-phosphate synthase